MDFNAMDGQLGPVRRSLAIGAWLLLVAATALTAACGPRTATAPRAAAPSEPADLVVLVHGLGRTRISMLPLAWELERHGYQVLNWGYGSTSRSIAEIGRALGASVDSASRAAPTRRVHFVGHSLGNIIVRWTLNQHRPDRLGRVVMLAPPNQGSRAADRYAPWFGWLLKPLPELRTLSGSTVRSLATPREVEFGIVAGSKDSRVSVAETALPGAADQVVVPAGHTFLMARDDVQEMVVAFLRTGRFRATQR